MHWVYGQEKSVSCGVACAVMAVYKINKITPGKRATYSEDELLKRARDVTRTAKFLGINGLNANQMLTLLNDPTYKMPGWKFSQLSPKAVADSIVKTVGVSSGFGPVVSVSPMIVMINWTSGPGHHWVLVDTVREFGGTKYASVCDPWDANVHFLKLEKGKNPNYSAEEVTAVDIWGTRKQYSSRKGNLQLGIVLSR